MYDLISLKGHNLQHANGKHKHTSLANKAFIITKEGVNEL